MYQLNVPALSSDLTAALIAQAEAMLTQENLDAWKTKRPYPFTAEQMASVNIADRLGNYISPDDDLKAVIDPAIPVSVNYEFYMMKNSQTGTPAIVPPFKDFKRSIAINYFLQLGGADLEQNFYFNEASGQEKKIYDLTTEKTSSYQVQAGVWYGFDSTAVTSFSGIDDTCIMICVSLDDSTVTFDELLAAHPELFGTKMTPTASAS